MSFHSNSKADRKVQRDYYKNYTYSRVPKTLVDWRQCATLKETLAPFVYLVIFYWLIIIQTHSGIAGGFDA